MSQLAREFPEEYAKIAALPLGEQNAAERALADQLVDHRRAHPETAPVGAQVERRCRDCEGTYMVPIEKKNEGSKWWSLCGSCLQWEI